MRQRLDLRAQRRQLSGDVALRRRRDEHLRLTVVDDVRHLLRRQVRVDAREVEAGALCATAGLEHARVVLHEERHVVESLQPQVTKQVRDAIAAALVLGEGDRLARGRHDDGRLIRMFGGVLRGVHAAKLFLIRRPQGGPDAPLADADEILRVDAENVARCPGRGPHLVVMQEVAVHERA